MSSLNLDENKSAYQIRAYRPGIIQVNDQKITHSIIISAAKLIANWLPQHITELTDTELLPAIALQPTILLIGTGSRHEFIPINLYGDCLNQGIGVEVMDTAAACRTYNALSAEGRNVVAALLIK